VNRREYDLRELLLPPQVLAQKAKTPGGTLEAPAYREETFAVAGKIAEKYAKDSRKFVGGRINTAIE